ncbi:MAG: hypothetical protein ABIG20_04810 [archaeon]
MRSIRNNKGWIRLVEVALASALVFGYITYLQGTMLVEDPEPEWDSAKLKSYGEDAFKSLDLSDVLGDYKTDLRERLLEGTWVTLGDDLDRILPENVAYALYFYSNTTALWELKAGIDDSQVSAGKDKVVVLYVVAGDRGEYCEGEGACVLKMVLWYII